MKLYQIFYINLIVDEFEKLVQNYGSRSNNKVALFILLRALYSRESLI